MSCFRGSPLVVVVVEDVVVAAAAVKDFVPLSPRPFESTRDFEDDDDDDDDDGNTSSFTLLNTCGAHTSLKVRASVEARNFTGTAK